MDNREKLRRLPKVDELAETLSDLFERHGRALVTDCAREAIEHMRSELLSGLDCEISMTRARALAEKRLETLLTPHLRPVINATGVVLHTNLGRAVMSERAARAAYEASRAYSNLEYDLEKGERGSRYSHVESLICRLTGAEAALVVNNNAAAVMLILSTVARGREVVVSRGELVEIGGAFRVPEIMEQSGGRLVEVGTTNKTHPYDYENAVTEDTGAFLKVHTSNFKITGFTEEVSLEELCRMGRAHGIPVIYDLGSGLMTPLDHAGITDEPMVLPSLAAGADIVSFSGDKLLGGPQAGIVLGKKELIAKMKKNPLTRALRVDKMSFAALEATLMSYLDPAGAREIPTIDMLSLSLEELRARAEALAELLGGIPGVTAWAEEEKSQVGGGSVPTVLLDTYAVRAELEGLSAAALEERLRTEHAVICRVVRDRVTLDVRTLLSGDPGRLAEAFRAIGEAKA